MRTPSTKVLLVEDEVAHVRLIKRAFSRRDGEFDLTVAGSLREARRALDEGTPDVAILDWLLPDGKGSELLNRGREKPEFPVVVMTSHGSEEVAVEAMKAGVIDYIVKQPTTLRDIPRLVERALREWGHVVERRKAEEELERYREHLEELVESRTHQLVESQEQLRLAERLAAVGTLAAGIAHEINNPIGSILAAAQLALLFKDEPDQQQVSMDALRDIEQQAIRCGRIVKSVLQFSRNQPTEKWEGDLRDIVRWAYDVSSTYAKQLGIEIGIDLPEAPITVLMNPIEMEQVLVNVIRNAIEANSEDRKVRIRCRAAGALARVEVSDRGQGIAPEDIHRIFDPFYTTRLQDGGTGLGLSVAHGLAVEHGGALTVESQLGLGTTMCLELPVLDARQNDPELTS